MRLDDAQLDALLKQDASDAVADMGFAERLLHRLPPQRASRRRRSRMPGRAAQVCALSAALVALALVMGSPLRAEESLLAVMALLGLITWWTLPQQRGSLWH